MLEHRSQGPGNHRVEVAARAPLDLTHRMRRPHVRALGVGMGHRVVGIRNRQNPRAEWDGRALQASGVAGAVKGLVVRQDELSRIAEPLQPPHELVAELWMRSHDAPFDVRERCGFGQNPLGRGPRWP